MRRAPPVLLAAATLVLAAVFHACGSSDAGPGGGGGDGGSSGDGAGGGDTGSGGETGPPAMVGDSVLMHHRNPGRDGVYVQPALTKAAAAGLKNDTTFTAAVQGPIYAQPLFVDAQGNGKDLLIVASESNDVYALDASTGAQVWKISLGTPVPLAKMPCGNIDPFGVTGTPVIDYAARTIYVAAMVTPDGGTTKQYHVFALSLDDGSTKSGWPVDMATKAKSGSTAFTADVHSQRGALALVGGTLYVPFGGLYGDCGAYHGWVVAISTSDPTQVEAWATSARAGGIWGASGIASDGANVYVTTGNTMGANAWGGGEALLRFATGGTLSATPAYWAPRNWLALDNGDTDMSGTEPIVFDLPGATPSHLVLALGKDGNAYLEDAANLTGVSDALAHASVASNEIINAAAVYTTATATYATFRGNGTMCTGPGGDLATIKLVAGSPPSIAGSWCANMGGAGSPMVTTTDGKSEAIVWTLGAEGNGHLQGFDGDTGATVFGGAGVNVAGIRRFMTPIAAKGRIFVASDTAVVAFKP